MPWDASFGNATSTPTYIQPTAAIVSIIAVLLGLGDSGFNTQIMGILGNLYKVNFLFNLILCDQLINIMFRTIRHLRSRCTSLRKVLQPGSDFSILQGSSEIEF